MSAISDENEQRQPQLWIKAGKWISRCFASRVALCQNKTPDCICMNMSQLVTVSGHQMTRCLSALRADYASITVVQNKRAAPVLSLKMAKRAIHLWGSRLINNGAWRGILKSLAAFPPYKSGESDKRPQHRGNRSPVINSPPCSGARSTPPCWTLACHVSLSAAG